MNHDRGPIRGAEGLRPEAVQSTDAPNILLQGMASLFTLVPLAVCPVASRPTQIKAVLFVVGVSLISLGWLWTTVRKEPLRFCLTPLHGLLLINVLLWGSGLLHPYPDQGLILLSQRLAGVALLLLIPALLTKKEEVGLILRLWVFSAWLMSIYGLGQFFHLDPFQGSQELVGHFRVTSTTDHPNIFVSFLVATIPVNLAGLFFFSLSKRQRGLWSAGLILCIGAAGATLSRGGWVALLVALLVTGGGIYSGRRRHRIDERGEQQPPLMSKKQGLLLALATVIFLGGVLGLGVSRGVLDAGEKERVFSLTGHSIETRVLVFDAGRRMMAAAPFWGLGLGNFSLYVPAFRGTALARLFPRNEYQLEHSPSEPLEVLVESGLVGLFAWVTLVGAFLLVSWRALRLLRDDGLQAVASAALGGLIGITLHSFLEVNLRFLPPLFLFWALPGLALALQRLEPAPPRRSWSLELTGVPSRILLSVIITLVLGVASAMALGQLAADIFTGKGNQRLLQKDYVAAQHSFLLAQRLWPGHLPAHYRRGYCLGQLGLLAQAEAEYRDVLRRSPYYFDTNHNLARVLFLQGELSQAAHWVKKAITLNPYHVLSYDLAVQVALARGQLAVARRLADDSGRRVPDHPLTRVMAARVLLAQGKREEARQLLHQMLPHASKQIIEVQRLLEQLDELEDHGHE